MIKRVADPILQELMVTLKNSGGVDRDKDSAVMNAYNSEVSAAEETTPSATGQAKAVLICRKNSHPFQERTLTLDQPVKIGRSVARARPSATNGIFDCKVLSRNHALIWFENEKFYIQDTKSSNGTFVNNQRLSKGSEDSQPKEIFSGDVVQFGVDVLENQRKGNEDSENSDDSNHIVTHGCIVATMKLFLPNGKEAKAGNSCSTPASKSTVAQEEICKLQVIIFEAQQREERLHDKLEELQLIIAKLELACQEALTNRFEETRLLSKIENLEKQTKVLSKIRPGSVDKPSEKAEMEIHQLLLDVEKVQSASREIQERQHRQLLENEQKLTEAERMAENLKLEVSALRDQTSRSESQVQELAKRCTSYSQLIDLLKETLSDQIANNQDLETRVEECQQREAELISKLQKTPKLKKKILIEQKGDKKRKREMDESDEEAPKKDKENDEIVLEWLDRYYTETGGVEQQRDRINEDDRSESFTKQLETLQDALHNGLQHISSCIGQLDLARLDLDKAKREVEKNTAKKQELLSQLKPFGYPIDQNEKTENDSDSEKNEIDKTILSGDNEKISELINELKELEERNHMLESCLQFYMCMVSLAKDLLREARQKQKEADGRCNKLKCELDAALIRCEKLNLESCNLKTTLKNHSDCLEISADILRQHIAKLESEKEKSDKSDEKISTEIEGNKIISTDNKESQTISITLVTSETNTDSLEEESKIVEELNGSIDKDTILNSSEKNNSDESHNEKTVEDSPDIIENSTDESCTFNSLNNTCEDENGSVGNSIEVTDSSKPKEEGLDIPSHISDSNLTIWEKIQRMQSLSNRLLSDSSLTNTEMREMKELMNLIAEDLVRLLLREQQINKDKQNLQEKLDKSMSQADIAALGLANQFVVLMVGLLIYFVGGSALEFLGLTR